MRERLFRRLAAVQTMYRALQLAGQQLRHHLQRAMHGGLEKLAIVGGGAAQYIIRHEISVTGVADSDALPPEVGAPQLGDHAAQAVVTAVSAALLEPRRAGWQVQFVVGDQYLRERDLIKSGQRRRR